VGKISYVVIFVVAISNFVVAILKQLVLPELRESSPYLAEKLLRRAAAKMPPDESERWLNQYLGDLDYKAKRVGKITLLLWAIKVWFRSSETAEAALGVEPRGVWQWIRDRVLWVTPLIALVMCVIAYPPIPDRYQAYALLTPLLVISAVYLFDPAKDALARGYGRIGYRGQVGLGGITAPVIGYFIVVFSLLPPSPPDMRHAPDQSRGATPPTVVFMTVPAPNKPIDAPHSNEKAATVKPHSSVRLARRLLPDKTTYAVENPNIHVLPQLDISELSATPVPPQPIFSAARMLPPASPGNLRILKYP
jgi:hypothetical protein